MESRKEAFHRYNQFNQLIRAIIIGILTGLVVSVFRLIIQHFLQLVTARFCIFSFSSIMANTMDDRINYFSIIIRMVSPILS